MYFTRTRSADLDSYKMCSSIERCSTVLAMAVETGYESMQSKNDNSEHLIDSHYHRSRGARVYASTGAFSDLCGITDPVDAERGILLYPYMVINVLDIIDDAIEAAVRNHDIERERALHCLYSQIVTACHDAGFDQAIALRHMKDLSYPVDHESELPDRGYQPIPMNYKSENEVTGASPVLSTLYGELSAGNRRKVSSVLDDYVKTMPVEFGFGKDTRDT